MQFCKIKKKLARKRCASLRQFLVTDNNNENLLVKANEDYEDYLTLVML